MNKRSDQQVIPGALDRMKMSTTEVRDARLSLGLQQRELAVVMGVRPRTVSKWERCIGCSGAARELLLLLVRHPGILFLLGINFPARPPILEEVGDGGEIREVPEVQSAGDD